MSTSVSGLPTPKKVRSIQDRLYVGKKVRGELLGDILKRMARENGRDVVRSQSNRWDQNRAFFRGDQHLSVNPAANTVRAISRDTAVSVNSHTNRDTFNRLRQFTEGRVAMMTAERPPFIIEPPDQDTESVAGAKLATKFIKAQWDQEGWGIQAFIRELAMAAEIDGFSVAYVGWNPHKGVRKAVPKITPEGLAYLEGSNIAETHPDLLEDHAKVAGEAGAPVLSRKLYEFLKQADPAGEVLWETSYERLGDVEFRVVRPGALSFDPFATKADDLRWVVESAVYPRQVVEQMAGKDLKKLLKENREKVEESTSGGLSAETQEAGGPDVTTDDGDHLARRLPSRDALLCHRAYHLPDADFPYGAHIFWVDQAPNVPIIMEPYDEERLPYIVYTPKPDYGHFIRARATVDDLMPMQVRLNRVLTLLNAYLDRVGKPPIAMPRGALVGDSIYNENDYFEYHPGLGEGIHYFQAPSEPTAVLTNHLQWIEMQMAEVAAQSASARGQSNAYSPDAAIGIQTEIQQTQLQLSGTEAELKQAIERCVSRSLYLVGKYYDKPRLVGAPGVDTTAELKAFEGSMLAGSHRFRVDGSLIPTDKAAQWQAMTQFVPLLGPEVRPYIADLVRGDVEPFVKAEHANREKQRDENQVMAAVTSHKLADAVWEDFQEQQQMYMQAMQMMQGFLGQQIDPDAHEPGAPAGDSGMNNAQLAMMQMAQQPPNLTKLMRAAGIQVPSRGDFDDDVQHLAELGTWGVSDGYELFPEMVKQLAREHRDEHLQSLSRNMLTQGAGAAPAPGEPGQPSDPAPTGVPSPPSAGGAPEGGEAAPPPQPGA